MREIYRNVALTAGDSRLARMIVSGGDFFGVTDTALICKG